MELSRKEWLEGSRQAAEPEIAITGMIQRHGPRTCQAQMAPIPPKTNIMTSKAEVLRMNRASSGMVMGTSHVRAKIAMIRTATVETPQTTRRGVGCLSSVARPHQATASSTMKAG